MVEFDAPIRGRLPRALMSLFHGRIKLDMPERNQSAVSPLNGFTLVRFSATATWFQKTLELQGVPLQGHTTH